MKGKTMQKTKTDPAIKVDIRSKYSAYITIGKWVIYRISRDICQPLK